MDDLIDKKAITSKAVDAEYKKVWAHGGSWSVLERRSEQPGLPALPDAEIIMNSHPSRALE
jgi:hypothetical protein